MLPRVVCVCVSGCVCVCEWVCVCVCVCVCQRVCVRNTHPDRTPSTRLSMKKEPMMMRGMKYIQFHELPEASLLCKYPPPHTHTVS